MVPEEIRAIEEVLEVGLETAFLRILNDPRHWGGRQRAEAAEAIEAAIRAGIEAGVRECLLNPFPRRGTPQAILNNAKPAISAAVKGGLKKLAG